MSSSQKFSIQKSIAEIAQNNAALANAMLGKNLPAVVQSVQGYFVTVKINVLDIYNFPLLTVPVAASQYTKEPLQNGDAGFLIPCDADISNISGMGSVSDLSQPSNLSSLVFQPVGNSSFTDYPDPQAYYATGITDAWLRDSAHQMSLEGNNAAWLSLISQINALLVIIGSGLTTPTVLTPITAATNPVKVRT